MTCKSRPSPQTEYAGRTHAMGATYVREWLGFVVADHAQRRAQAADLVVPDHQRHAVRDGVLEVLFPSSIRA